MRKIFFYLLLISSITVAQQWKFLGLSSESITSIAVDWENSNIIYAGSGSDFSSGKRGGIFKSINAGATWDTIVHGVTVYQLIIHPKDPNIIFATLGLNGLTVPGIIKTTNGGTSWQETDSGIYITGETGPTQLAIDYNYPDTMYCGTAGFYGGSFYRSTNGGESWTSLGDSTSLINGVVAIAIAPDSSNIVFASTEFTGDLLKSTNYGVDWDSTGFVSEGSAIWILQFVKTSLTIYAGCSPGFVSPTGIFKTTDGGATWSNPKAGLPDTVTVSDIQIGTKGEIFCVANFRDSGGVYEKNQINIWKKIGIGSTRVGPIALSGTKLYAGCRGGIYVTDYVMSIIEEEQPRLNNFRLLQNFPNPFNPETKINYELPKGEFVTLKVYDVLGREVATIVNEFKTAGSYNVNFNAGNFASGIYFYRFKSGSYISTKKMMLLK